MEMLEPRVLVVDDDAEMCRFLEEALGKRGFQVIPSLSAEGALKVVESEPVDVVISDLRLKDMGGLELLEKTRALKPSLPFIVITAFGSIETAVEAMRRGAYNYVTKPFRLSEILVVLRKAQEDRDLRQEVRRLREELDRTAGIDGIIGKSKAMQEVFDLIYRIRDSLSNVLILGESGTGKELIARAIHAKSPRREGPFVPVNCAAIPETLLESELFGYVKGAFTDARTDKTGLFAVARGGTIFLDEILDLPLPLQPKLLRAIQEREIRRVGSTRTEAVDVRVVAATNKVLAKAVAEGSFREDLYYRLNVITIQLPPLRERKEDLLPLSQFLLAKTLRSSKKGVLGFSEVALKALEAYDWPGNVRELENIIERAVALCEGDHIDLRDLAPQVTSPHGALMLAEEALAKGWTAAEVEREYIQRVLRETKGNKVQAAGVLGFTRGTLYRKLEKYRIAQQG